MDEASQREPDPHIISGDQTMGQVRESNKPTAVPDAIIERPAGEEYRFDWVELPDEPAG